MLPSYLYFSIGQFLSYDTYYLLDVNNFFDIEAGIASLCIRTATVLALTYASDIYRNPL